MNNRTAIAISLSAIMILGVTLASSRNAYAHTFSGDESASFLATVEVIKVHLTLAKNDFATDPDLSAEHVEHASEHLTNDTIKEITERNNRLGTELPASFKELQETLEAGNATAADVNEQIANINSLIDETVSVRIEKTQLTNSTVQGTVLAELVDEVLESYSGAYEMEEEEYGSMNDNETDKDEESMDQSSNSTSPTDEELENLTTFELDEKYPDYIDQVQGGNETSTIVNMMEYESAKTLAARAQELFDTKLKALVDANATEAVTALDSGLKKLKQAIDDKAPLDDVDMIVHTDIHPNIQKAFNLEVVPEFPLPILAAIMGITSVVAYSRMRGRKFP
jgi:hypothetical protein